MKIKDIIGERAYHGTPHEVDKFSTDHVGTGEGAQYYGWGLYFASRREVAEWYKKMLTGGRFNANYWPEWFGSRDAGVVRDASTRLFGHDTPAMNAAMLLWNAAHGGAGTLEDVIAKAQKYKAEMYGTTNAEIERVARGIYKGPENPGAIYTVEIPDDTTFLVWEKPLKNQPGAVKAALKTIVGKRKGLITSDMTGGAAYMAIAKAMGSDKRLSLMLLKYGVHGAKHLDGVSRRHGEGTYNYVIFDGALAQITGKE